MQKTAQEIAREIASLDVQMLSFFERLMAAYPNSKSRISVYHNYLKAHSTLLHAVFVESSENFPAIEAEILRERGLPSRPKRSRPGTWA